MHPTVVLRPAGRRVAVALALLCSVPCTARAQGVDGIWLDHEQKAAIEIKTCADRLCGSVVWLQQQLGADGRPLLDKENSDVSKRGAPICGLQIIGDLKPAGSAQWTGGWIYDPEEGKTYDLELALDGAVLKVRAFWSLSLLGETYEWKRSQVMLPRCKT